MKNSTSSLIYVFLVVGTLIWMSNNGGRANIGGQGATGAPCENGQVCATCHNSGSYGSITQTMAFTDLTTGMLSTEYIPSRTYEVTITVAPQFGNPTAYGFQACSLDENDGDIGKWQNLGANVQAVLLSSVGACGSRNYVEHGGGASASGTFTMEWEAPSMDVGDITFYYIGNCVNGNGGTSGDRGGFGQSTTITPACPPDLVINDNPIVPETYEATNSILSSGVISAGVVEFTAGNTIELQSDFEVQQGSDFTATIDPQVCN